MIGPADHKARMQRLKSSGRSGQVRPVAPPAAPMQHVAITGHSAKQELIEAADLVTEMGQLQHPFRKGIKVQKGGEF
jgi:cob(I)alamin adenosyltransferase